MNREKKKKDNCPGDNFFQNERDKKPFWVSHRQSGRNRARQKKKIRNRQKAKEKTLKTLYEWGWLVESEKMAIVCISI